MATTTLARLQKRLDALALEQLREVAAKLYEELEETKDRLYRAEESADFWQQHAQDLQQSLHDDEFATHRCVGLTQSGEMMVVRTDA